MKWDKKFKKSIEERMNYKKKFMDENKLRKYQNSSQSRFERKPGDGIMDIVNK